MKSMSPGVPLLTSYVPRSAASAQVSVAVPPTTSITHYSTSKQISAAPQHSLNFEEPALSTEKHMNELLDWLRLQKGGVGTYTQFCQKALAHWASQPSHAALDRLPADVAGHFADAYDGEPLHLDVAERALNRLSRLVERAVRVNSLACRNEQVALLNEIGLAELT